MRLRAATLREFGHGERHATWLELFFDLCFVAAVASLADWLHHHPTPDGVLTFVGLFVPVWWAWMGYTWYASAFDNDDPLFRLSYLGAMLAVIILAASIGGVGSGESHMFVLAYVALQLILAGLYLRAWLSAPPDLRPYCARYGLGDAIGALIWLGSLLVPEPARYAVWVVAMVVLMSAPVVAVSSYAGRAFDPAHIPERYGLFTLIVLGESIVVVVAGTASTGIAPVPALIGVAGFALAACVWWIYFDGVKAVGLRRENLWSSFVWGYGHLLIFAGIAAAAVGVELAIEAAAHDQTMGAVERAILFGGMLAFLLAISAIHAISTLRIDRVLVRRLIACATLAAVALLGGGLAPLVMVALLAAIAVWLLLSEVAASAPSPVPASAAPD